MKNNNLFNPCKGIIIYGTGEIAKKIFMELKEEGKENQIVFFLDSLMQKKSFCNKAVHPLAFLEEINVNNFFYYLGTYTNTKSMREELFRHNVLEENIIEVEDYAVHSLEKNIVAVKRILFFPEFKSSSDLEQITSELRYIFPRLFETNLMMEAAGQIPDAYHDAHVQVVDELLFSEDAVILVWDKVFLKDKRLQSYKKILCIDKTYFDIINIRIFLRLNYLLSGEKACAVQKEISAKNMEVLSGKFQKAYIVGNGPGCIEGIKKIPSLSPSLRIACNLFIKSQTYMSMLKPNLYVLADEGFTSSKVSPYIDMIAEYIVQEDCYLAAPNEIAMAFSIRYPACRNKVIAFGLDAKAICFPTTGNMKVYRKAYNVITALAIPIASSLCDEIYIMGCDGMKLETNNGWEYAEEIPAKIGIERNVSLDDEYIQYYRQHIHYMEEIIHYGIKNGKQYYNISKSYIPVLDQLGQKHSNSGK